MFVRKIGRLLPLALIPMMWAQFSPLTISTTSLPNGATGSAYSQQVMSNATAAGMWSITGGSLPPGLAPTGASGPNATISGTPTATGSFPFQISVFDPQRDSSASANLSITINSISQLSFVTSSPLPTAMIGTQYSQNVVAAGGAPPYAFSAANLPAGLSMTSTGAIFGTPTTAGGNTITVTLTDQAQASVTSNFSLTVTPQLLITNSSPLPPGVATGAYNQTIGATGGTPPYAFSITDSIPPGFTLSPGGALTGIPSAVGTFTFTVQVTDHLNFTAAKKFQITVAAAAPLLQVSPQSLSFIAAIGGSSPSPQSLSIVSSNATAAGYAVTIDGGAAGVAPPPWLTVTPLSGTSPARLTVSANPGQLAAQTYKATIHITVPKSTTQASIDVAVTFTIAGGTPLLQVTPASLRFGARVQAPGIQQQTIAISNAGGGGALNFTASVVGQSTWITGVSPTSGATAPNSPALLQVQVNSLALRVGNYHDIIRITSAGVSNDVAVSLFVSDQGAILGLNVTGLRFQTRQGGGSNRPQIVPVLDLGDASSIVNWTADLLSGSDWLTVTNGSGTATPAQPGNLVLTPNAGVSNLPVGPRYALVRISDANGVNAPQYLSAVLDNAAATTSPLPDPSPAGLFFTSSSSASKVLVYTSTSTPAAFQASASTSDGANWLLVTPASGIASTSSPGQVTVSVNTANLAFGIYTGSINIGMSGALRMVNVTLVVAAAVSSAIQSHATCSPTALALTQIGLVNNFAVPAGWPATLIAQLNDNCGNAVATGSVVASFSNGDPPLSLRGDQTTNTYSSTWQPGTALPQMTIGLRGTSGALQPANEQLIGAVNANAASPPALLPNGTVHIFFDGATAAALGGGLAPGNVAQVYGTGLAPALVGSATVPLQNQISGTFMLVGGIQAPLFFVRGDLIGVQLPFELTPNRQYAAIVSANGALSLPITLDVVPVQPGVDAANFNPSGSVVAQHLDYSLVTGSSPAHPGEGVVIYLAGMGATNPSVGSGNPTPSQLVPVSVQPTLTLDGQNCTIQYAGLTPSGVGLYQINFTVPSNARSGNLNLVVTQSGVTSNTTTLPVSN